VVAVPGGSFNGEPQAKLNPIKPGGSRFRLSSLAGSILDFDDPGSDNCT